MTINQALIKTLLDPLEDVAIAIRRVNEDNGWYDHQRPLSADAALLHSEVSELYEAHRHKNPPSEHIPEFSAMEEEAADILIRLLDTVSRHNLRLGPAVAAKLAFNATRGYKHGGKAE